MLMLTAADTEPKPLFFVCKLENPRLRSSSETIVDLIRQISTG